MEIMNNKVTAVKFVQWDVNPQHCLCCSKVYLLRAKLNSGKKMTRTMQSCRKWV